MTNPDPLAHVHDHARGHEHDPGGGTERFLFRGRWVFWIFGIVAAVFLISEHRAHVWGALPYLILLACPLMHVFMHGGHGGHGGHGSHGGSHSNHGDAANRAPSTDKPRDWE